MGCSFKPTLVTDKYKQQIAQWISGQHPSVSTEFVFDALEVPKNSNHGDFSIPIPKLRIPGNPIENAKALSTEFSQSPIDGIRRVSQEGVFLNFSINLKEAICDILDEIKKQGSKFGWSNYGAGKNVVIEYGSPNIAKPFHAGHLRSSVLGNFLKHAYTANGYRVTSINYLGDWGKQFGLLAVGYLKYGSQEEMEKDAIKHLFNVYVKISADASANPAVHDEARAFFKRMEDGDEEALGLWRVFRNLSISKYEKVFDDLNVKFDVYSGESCYESAMKGIVSMLSDSNLLTESKNAMVVDLSAEKLGTTMILKSDGTTLYLTRDIAAAIDREEKYHPAESLYVVCATQSLHFQQLFAILRKMNFPWVSKLRHIGYGMVTGMSTRRGTVVFLEDILEEAYQTMHDVMKSNPKKYSQIEDPEAVARALAVSAIVVQDFSAKKIKDYDFSMERMTSFEGDTGPFLQYTHVRLCSIERKVSTNISSITIDHELLMTELGDSELVLQAAKKLAQFPSVVYDSCANCEPNTLVTYLMALCHSLSSLLEQLPVLQAPTPQTAAARLYFFSAARQVISNGIHLLGLQPLERM